DQGIMFGFACRDTKAYMPAPIYYAHKILRTISNDIHDKKLAQLGPDGKCQISIQYKDGKPHKATSIVLSIQHSENLSQEQVRTLVRPYIEKALPDGWVCPDANIFINPTGRFVIGGPDGDAGLTGRKLTVDTYGGSIPHGGGSFSGKDPSKVDRSATYALRYLAKNIVAAGLADSCTLQLSYGIGISHPISLYINCHHTAKIPEQKILDLIPKLMDLSPRGIRDHLKLDRPIYERTATFGHFGPDPDADGGFSWERLDLVEKFKEILQ
ncbi:MAG: methionine adenosyltransferase, partial [Alphaproteobacteria bacterium]|nr:methionine adenosyltransferase [Alphaproteobacteria bacterium]